MTFVPVKELHPTLDTTYESKQGSDQWINQAAAEVHQVPTHAVSPALQERGDKRADSDCIQAHVIIPPITLGFDKRRGEFTGEEMAGTLRCNEGKREGVNSGKADNQCVAFRAAGQDGFNPEPISPPLMSSDGGGTVPTAFFLHSQNSQAMKKDGAGNAGGPAEIARALDTTGGFTEGQGGNVVVNPKRYQVRRLTPVECERLQGFADDFTRYGVDDKGRQVEHKDSPRYRQVGNAWTTFVADWLAIRIKKFGYKL